MNKSQLKRLIKEVIQEMGGRGGLNTEFATEINLDLRQMRKGDWTIDDVPVKVEATGGYNDSSFDWEMGSEGGRHDPGSGVETDKVTIISVEDLPMHDVDGNPMPGALLFKAGQEIPEKFIEVNSLARLHALADKQLENSVDNEPDVDNI
jgi:hypothetical protein